MSALSSAQIFGRGSFRKRFVIFLFMAVSHVHTCCSMKCVRAAWVDVPILLGLASSPQNDLREYPVEYRLRS